MDISEKIKKLRQGIIIGTVATASLAPMNAKAQVQERDSVSVNKELPDKAQDEDDDIFTLSLSPEDMILPSGKNAETYEEMRKDFDFIADLTDFHDGFKNNPEAYERPKKLRIKPMYSFISKHDFEECAQYKFQTGKKELASLSCKDYQSICLAKNIEATAKKLMSMQALGQTAQADSILPDFSQKYADKISVSSINASMSGDDWAALKEDIAKNFTHIYPDFVQKTQDFWKQNNPDYGYEMKINDNQYIAITLTKQYDVTDEKNRQLASQTRQYYYDLVDSLQQSYMNTRQTEQARPMSAADKIKALQQGKSVEDASKNPQDNKPHDKQNNMNMQILQNARQNIK